jgi:hypothetical protein
VSFVSLWFTHLFFVAAFAAISAPPQQFSPSVCGAAAKKVNCRRRRRNKLY